MPRVKVIVNIKTLNQQIYKTEFNGKLTIPNTADDFIYINITSSITNPIILRLGTGDLEIVNLIQRIIYE